MAFQPSSCHYHFGEMLIYLYIFLNFFENSYLKVSVSGICPKLTSCGEKGSEFGLSTVTLLDDNISVGMHHFDFN